MLNEAKHLSGYKVRPMLPAEILHFVQDDIAYMENYEFCARDHEYA